MKGITGKHILIIVAALILLNVIIGINTDGIINNGVDRTTRNTEKTISSKRVSVERVWLDKSRSGINTIKGMIRNNTSGMIKGNVTIKYINSSGDIIGSTRAYVNDGDPFSSGRAASFDYSGEPSEFRGVVDFEVIFNEK